MKDTIRDGDGSKDDKNLLLTFDDQECKRIENEFNELRVKVCEQVETSAQANYPYVLLAVSDVRQLLHVLSLTPFHVKTMDEAMADLNARKRLEAAPRAQGR